MDTMAKKILCHVRWLIRRELDEVLAIENQSFAHPWSHDDFIRHLKERCTIGLVAELDERIAGYIVYEFIGRTRLHILNLAVNPILRRRGIASQLVGKLISKLTADRRNRLTVDVNEYDSVGQHFFRSLNFKATKVLRNFYGEQDAYAFEYCAPKEAGWDE